MDKKNCGEMCGHSCAGGSGGFGGGMGMGCAHGGCHGGKHYLLKMLLKLIILALIFMFGFNLGQMTGFIKAGYTREIMRGGNYGEGMILSKKFLVLRDFFVFSARMFLWLRKKGLKKNTKS